ncbi:MAG TPA: ABC transporter substrate-binding protein [Candidatus Limnocylindria bacterium]|nr:ABC transporter substrate-binding protein [Candidatus Limnocylindria bacterium]
MSRTRRLLAVCLVLATILAACGGGGTGAPGATTAGKQLPGVTIGSFNFTESVILGEVYGLALEDAGFKYTHRSKLGNREIVFPALEKGEIEIVPEYLATSLAFVTKASAKIGDPATAYRQYQEALRPKSITALDFANAIDTNAFVVTKATADKHKLRKMSDLAAVAGQLTLGAPPECPQRPFCLQGLKDTYGITFKEFKPLDAGGPLTVAAVQAGQVDVGLLFSTDGRIAANGFVLLEDDKKLQAADNVVPVVRNDLLNRAEADLRRVLNGVSAKLTTEALTDLNRQVDIDKKDAKDVARDWLKKQGLIR